MSACCDWETFEDGFNHQMHKLNFPEILVDRKKAKRLWKKGYTGYEAFMTITKDERAQLSDVRDADFIAKLRPAAPQGEQS
jgi:hypothetical protein